MLVDGKEKVVSSAEDVKELAKELGIAKDSGEGLRDTLLTFNNAATSFQNAAQGIQELTRARAGRSPRRAGRSAALGCGFG